MVLSAEKVVSRTKAPLPREERVAEAGESQGDSVAVARFVEAITGRQIREQVRVDHAKIQSGRMRVAGEPVGQYINGINDSFRDHEDFDVIAGSGYTKAGRKAEIAIVLHIRPGLTFLDKAMLAGSIPARVPLDTKIVFSEWGNLTPQAASQRRVTHNSYRLGYGEDPKLRIR